MCVFRQNWLTKSSVNRETWIGRQQTRKVRLSPLACYSSSILFFFASLLHDVDPVMTMDIGVVFLSRRMATRNRAAIYFLIRAYWNTSRFSLSVICAEIRRKRIFQENLSRSVCRSKAWKDLIMRIIRDLLDAFIFLAPCTSKITHERLANRY